MVGLPITISSKTFSAKICDTNVVVQINYLLRAMIFGFRFMSSYLKLVMFGWVLMSVILSHSLFSVSSMPRGFLAFQLSNGTKGFRAMSLKCFSED